MSQTATPPQPRRTTLYAVLATTGVAVLGVFSLLLLYQILGYGWDNPQERAIPALIIFFAGGMIAFQRRRSLALRAFALVVAIALAVPIWWLSPRNGTSLWEAARTRDELKADLSTQPTFENASIASHIRHKHDSLLRSSPSMASGFDRAMDLWRDKAVLAVVERLRNIPTDDPESVLKTSEVGIRVAGALKGTYGRIFDAQKDWIAGAVVARKSELESLPRGDWVGFDQTADGRHALADTFGIISPESLQQLVSAEGTWIQETANEVATASLGEMQMNPKLLRELCYETEKQLLALNSLDSSPDRFLAPRATLFKIARDTVHKEIQEHIEAKRYDHAYGIARKFAVDWFKTAEMLGPEQQKRLEELRDRCRDKAELAEKNGDSPEAAPIPRTRETAPAPRLKP
jgi:hypothetical protein